MSSWMDEPRMIIPKKDVVVRYAGNPILKPRDMPMACCALYNSGCVKTPDGEYVMACRFESPNKRQFIWIARSRDGIHFTPDPQPLKYVCAPEEQELFEEATRPGRAGVGTWWDPRINCVEGTYYITYAANSPHGCRIGIARTEDFKTAYHVSFPLHIQNRNGVLFPEKIGGEYWMLHRPQDQHGGGSIWIASSPDFKYWGNCRVVADPEYFWEKVKIGPGAPPIRTDEGYLELYHGVFAHCNGINYAMGAMLLDAEQPWRVIARTKHPLLFVEELYEMVGQVPNVIFVGAAVPEEDGTVKIYYGAADYVECLATAKLDDLIEACFGR